MSELAYSGETVECPPVSALMHQQNCIVLVVLVCIFIIGLLGMVGIEGHIPILYTWNSSALSLTVSEAVAIMGLAVGAAAFIGAKVFCRMWLVWLARVCFLGALFLGLLELKAYFTVPLGLTMEDYLVPQSPFLGHIPIYAALGFSLTGALFLLASLKPNRGIWLQWTVQSLGIFLMSLGGTGLFEYLANPPIFHYLGSVPLSVSFIGYGLAFLFFPFENELLVAPFFASSKIQAYAWVLLSFWVVLIGWQALIGSGYINRYHLVANPVYFRVALNQVLITLMSSLILAFGLYILYLLIIREKLAVSLQSSSQKLRESLDSLSLLASTLSHDLKGPILTQIKAVELLGSGRYGQEISAPANQEILSAILDNNQFELDLVLNLINLLRYKIQDAPFEPKPIKLKIFLEDIRKELVPLVQRKEQVLSVAAQVPEDQLMLADPLGLKRVLHNLMNNAIMHLAEGHHIWVAVDLRETDFLFSVKDDGPGIPQETQAKLFNQFNRMSSSGLGLYITKQIVERHGGTIWIESELDHGACFYFTIPKTPPVRPDGAKTNGLATKPDGYAAPGYGSY